MENIIYLCDIRGLLLYGNDDIAGSVVEALGDVIVSNLLQGFTDNLIEIPVEFTYVNQ
jgi:hypothetical protein